MKRFQLGFWENPRGTGDRVYINGVVTEGKIFFSVEGGEVVLRARGLPEGEDEAGLLNRLRNEVEAELIRSNLLRPGAELTLSALQAYASRQSSKAEQAEVGGEGWSRHKLSRIQVPSPVEIIIDHAQPDALVSLFSPLENVQVRQDRLAAGSLMINGRIVVDRRVCSPEMNAIEAGIDNDGELFRTAADLRSKDEAWGLVILEGDPHRTARRAAIQQIDGAISNLFAVQGLGVLTTLDLQHTAYICLRIAVHDRSGAVSRVPPRSRPPAIPRERLAYVLEGIPGVSRETGRALLATFGSIRRIANASVDDLKRVRGIGEERARRIHNILREAP